MPIILGFQAVCSDCGHVYKTFGGHACPRPSKYAEARRERRRNRRKKRKRV